MRRDNLDKRYYRIREVAEILGLPQSTLRFWENQFTIINPRRSSSGIRLYTATDIETIRLIYFLVKEKGLKLGAAPEEIRRNPHGVNKRFETIKRLRGIRDRLQSILDALNKMR